MITKTIYEIDDLGNLAIEDFLKTNEIPKGKECFWKRDFDEQYDEFIGISVFIEDVKCEDDK